MATSSPGQQPPQDSSGPRISPEYCDVPTQRFYAAALFVLLQSYKLFAFIEHYLTSLSAPASSDPSSERTWLLLKYSFYDVLFLCILLPWLRIPRINIDKKASVLLAAGIVGVNWIIMGDWHASALLRWAGVILPGTLKDYFAFDLAILEHRIRYKTLLDPATHILGSHTIRILPHSTAQFLPLPPSFSSSADALACVSVEASGPFNAGHFSTLPILLNNTKPKWVQYSVQGFGEEERRLFNLSAKDLTLVAVPKRRWTASGLSGSAGTKLGQGSRGGRSLYEQDMEDWEEEQRALLVQKQSHDYSSAASQQALLQNGGSDDESGTLAETLLGYDGNYDTDFLVPSKGRKSKATPKEIMNLLRKLPQELESSQSIYTFRVSQPGIIRIERVIDSTDNDVRIPNPSASDNGWLVVPCPAAAFTQDSSGSKGQTTCQDVGAAMLGLNASDEQEDKQDIGLSVSVFGYPPLTLSYHRVLLGSTSAAKSSGSVTGRDLQTIEGIAPDGALLSPHIVQGGKQQQQNLLVTKMSSVSSFGQTRPSSIDVPLNVSHVQAGTHVFLLDRVSDALGHSLDFTKIREHHAALSSTSGTASHGPAAHARKAIMSGSNKIAGGARLQEAAERKIVVHPRHSAAFFGCGASNSPGLPKKDINEGAIRLLHGKKAKLQIRVGSLPSYSTGAKVENDDTPFKAKLVFTPEDSDTDQGAKGWEKAITLHKRQEIVEVDKPGRYRIQSFQGAHCEGEILEPSECTVYTPAVPTVDLSLTPITDACAGEVGLRAIFSLSGEGPYKINYSVTHGSSTKKYTKTIRTSSRDELEFKPEQTGEFTYEFISLDDRNYEAIPIGKSVKQIVHPLGGAKFVMDAGKEKNIHVCEITAAEADDKDGEIIRVPISLKGTAPWSIDYRLVGSKEIHTVNDIPGSAHDLSISIPARVQKKGGSFTLSIVNVRDGRGCVTPVTADDLTVNIIKSHPAASFVALPGASKGNKVLVKQGDTVRMPLALTGDGPWKLTYQHDSDKPRTVSIKAPNGQLLVDQAGTYRLLSVSDSHCPGTIPTSIAASSYSISWIEKPTVSLGPNLGTLAKNGSIVRAPVCEGVDDTASLSFSGHSPWTVTYETTEDGTSETHNAGKRRISQDLQSVQRHAQFELSTSTPGHRAYELTGIADATYSSMSKAGLVAPEGSKHRGLLRLEQDVLARPTAIFLDQDKLPIYCVRDSLQSTTQEARTPALRLTGLPPFRVEFEVTPDGSHMSQRYSDVYLPTKNWKLALPHTLSEPGPFTIHVRKLVDATGCERMITRGAKGSFASIEVVEIASVSPVQAHQVDHCVGDSIDFVLQGTSPWTVNYSFNGKKQSVVSKDSRFSRVAESPGSFEISSVAHHQDSCKSLITDVKKVIHALPAAKVHSGNTYIENIREGDQAEIVFEFEGTPPFTFTYTKSAPATGKNRKPTALETHTITGVETHRYSIFTQSEGTWAVTSVTDAFCSYPPLARSDRKMLTSQ